MHLAPRPQCRSQRAARPLPLPPMDVRSTREGPRPRGPCEKARETQAQPLPMCPHQCTWHQDRNAGHNGQRGRCPSRPWTCEAQGRDRGLAVRARRHVKTRHIAARPEQRAPHHAGYSTRNRNTRTLKRYFRHPVPVEITILYGGERT